MSASNLRHKILILFSSCLKAKQKPNHIKLPVYYYHLKVRNWFSSSEIIKKISTYSVRDLFDAQNYFVAFILKINF